MEFSTTNAEFSILGVVGLALDPQNPAMVELARLVDQEAQLRTRLDQANVDARRASAELVEAREALIALEAGAPTAQQRAAAEKRLAGAEQNAHAPWRERIQGAERALRDAHQNVQHHATEHLDELVEELEEAGQIAAEGVNLAAEAFLAAVARHTEAERALTRVVAVTGRAMSPNDISRPKSDQARSAVQSLLATGGESGPVFRVREQVTAA